MPPEPLTPAPLSHLRRLKRSILARRRLLAVVCVLASAGVAVRATQLPPTPQETVVVAAADLPGGHVLGPGDLALVEFPVGSAPAGVLRNPDRLADRVLAAPVRRGEPITDVRVVLPGIVAGYPGLVAAPVRLADAAVVSLLQTGDRVDVVATDPQGGAATLIAPQAQVIAIPEVNEDESALAGGLVVVAVTDQQSLELAQASVSRVLSVILSG